MESTSLAKTRVAPRRKTGPKKLTQHQPWPHPDMPDHKGLVLGPKLHGEHACAIYFDLKATWKVSRAAATRRISAGSRAAAGRPAAKMWPSVRCAGPAALGAR